MTPHALTPVVNVTELRKGYDAEHDARVADQRAAVDCGRKLAEVLLLVDAFNLSHQTH